VPQVLSLAAAVIDQVRKKFSGIHYSELQCAEEIIIKVLADINPANFKDQLVKLFVSILEAAVYKKSSLQNIYWKLFFQPHEYGIRLSDKRSLPSFTHDNLQTVVDLCFSKNEANYRKEKPIR
jgi:hypothetical protein